MEIKRIIHHDEFYVHIFKAVAFNTFAFQKKKNNQKTFRLVNSVKLKATLQMCLYEIPFIVLNSCFRKLLLEY